MSEHHPAETNPGFSEPSQGTTNWYSGWEEFSGDPEPDEASASSEAFPEAPQQDWHPVDPPNALRVSDLAQSSPGTAAAPQSSEPARSLPIDLPDWSVRTIPPQAPIMATEVPVSSPSEAAEALPDVDDLISLIQELNQCNSALLDRVTQLEDALDQSRKDLGRSPTSAPGGVSQEHYTQLFQELESTHQASQRQQVLIETLTGQLNHSQERMAKLEQECTALQQRLQEHYQQMLQSEQSNRDLQIRLQRQQHYTLQFKAALERCLEVSTPPFDLPDMTAANASVAEPIVGTLPAQPLSPKIRQIQPWSFAGDAGLPGKLAGFRSQPLTSHPPDATEAADMAIPSPVELAEALRANMDGTPMPPTPLSSLGQPATSSLEPDVQDTSQALQAAAAELKAVLSNLLNNNADSGPPAESEIWQDLARLAEVSTDDVMRATQIEDEGQFLQGEPASAPRANPIASHPTDKPRLSMPSEVFRQPTSAAAGTDPQARPGTSPAPIVYPFRPLKKIDSLAAVDLPKFPQT